MSESLLVFCPVARVDEVAVGAVAQVEVRGRTIALFNLAGAFFATDGICTHAYAPLADGCVDGETVECPLHGACFSIKTGEVLSPPATEPLATYAVRIEGEHVCVGVPEEPRAS